jgi:LysM repeat protein
MLIRKLLVYFIAALLLIPGFAFSETQEIKEYKVKKGDTLWDISNKELQDPFLWPKIWKENPDIKNPDLIYPDQIVKIPLYLLQKEVETPAPEPVAEKAPEPAKEEVKAETPPPVIKPLVDKNVYLASGFVATSLPLTAQLMVMPQEESSLATMILSMSSSRVQLRLATVIIFITWARELYIRLPVPLWGTLWNLLAFLR